MCWKFHFITRRKSVKKCHFITSATRPSPLVSNSMQLQFWRQRTETSLTSHFVGQPESRLCDVTFCPPIKSLTWCLPALAEWKIATAVKSLLVARRFWLGFREYGPVVTRMGAYLSEPVLEKHSEDGDAEFLSFGSSSMQGWRVSQEVEYHF